MKRIAFYGGSFDPVHRGHLEIAQKLTKDFAFDEFVFIPAFHAPHKKDLKPTSAFHRYAMLCLATRNTEKISVSKMELEAPQMPYTIETLMRLKKENPKDKIFFVMGADSWTEITSWKEWEKVLTTVNIIAVTRPEYEIGVSHITDEIRDRIIDVRGKNAHSEKQDNAIYFTDAVQINISSRHIRKNVQDGSDPWEKLVSVEVAKYIKKYDLYG